MLHAPFIPLLFFPAHFFFGNLISQHSPPSLACFLPIYLQILGSTVNGTTYCGRRARTTGAPQNHWYV